MDRKTFSTTYEGGDRDGIIIKHHHLTYTRLERRVRFPLALSTLVANAQPQWKHLTRGARAHALLDLCQMKRK